MPQESQQHKEGLFERVFEHHHHNNGDKAHEQSQGDQSKTSEQKPQHKEGEMDKFKDYIHKDEELEREGDTYGGLM